MCQTCFRREVFTVTLRSVSFLVILCLKASLSRMMILSKRKLPCGATWKIVAGGSVVRRKVCRLYNRVALAFAPATNGSSGP